MPDQPTDPTGGQPPAASVPQAPTATQAPPSQPAAPINPPQVDIDPNVENWEYWRSKFYGTQGAFKQAQSAWDEQRGASEQARKGLTAQLEAANAQLAQTQKQVAELSQQLEVLPQLQERATEANRLEALNTRLNVILRYPQIVGQTEEVEVTVGEGDEATTQMERRNPFMDLVLSSNLEGPELETMVHQIASKLNEPAEPALPPQPAASTMVGGGPPPTPAPSESVADLRQKAADARDAGDYNMAEALLDQIAELQDQQAS